MFGIMPIPSTTSLVARLWMDAEKQIRELVSTRYFDIDEETITKLFHGEFRLQVQVANSNNAVEKAFLNDLHLAFPQLQLHETLSQLAFGISATTALHPHEIEKITGGDLGIVFIRPNVTQQSVHLLHVETGYRRGLLCQAKLKGRVQRKAKWGTFTSNQKKNLPLRLDFLSLLLLEYTDQDRKNLAPFSWQLCSGATFDVIEQWRKSGQFPNRETSDKIITKLGMAEIGTDDDAIIEQYVTPKVRETMVVRIGWPPGREPAAQFHLIKKHVEQQVYVYQR